MSRIKLLMNYYLSPYLNNAKYKNRVVGKLKIYFEMNTGISNTPSVFGNVYRNSKWSSLSIQNIKKYSFQNEYQSSLMKLFTILIILTFYNVTLLDFLSPYLIYTAQFLYLSIFIIFSYIPHYFRSLFKDYLLVNYHVINSDSIHLNVHLNSKKLGFKSTLEISNKNYLSNSNALGMNSLHTLLMRLFNLNRIKSYTNPEYNIDQTPLNYINNNTDSNYWTGLSSTLMSRTLGSLPVPTYKTYIPITISKLDKDLINQNLLANSSLITKYSKNDTNLTNPLLYNNSIKQELNFVKQLRWATKNTISSKNLFSTTQAFRFSKSLIGNNLSNPTITGSNMWLSTNLNLLTSKQLSSMSREDNLLRTDLKHYPFFEESQFFYAKKFLLNNNISNLWMKKNLQIKTASTKYGTYLLSKPNKVNLGLLKNIPNFLLTSNFNYSESILNHNIYTNPEFLKPTNNTNVFSQQKLINIFLSGDTPLLSSINSTQLKSPNSTVFNNFNNSWVVNSSIDSSIDDKFIRSIRSANIPSTLNLNKPLEAESLPYTNTNTLLNTSCKYKLK